MWYVLLAIGTILLLTFVTCYVILQAAVSERPLRRLLLFVVLTTPFFAIVALVKTLFFRPQPIRYSGELGRIEDEIEKERAATFGGGITRPSFSKTWRVSYLYAVEKSAAVAVKLDPDLSDYCISQLQ